MEKITHPQKEKAPLQQAPGGASVSQTAHNEKGNAQHAADSAKKETPGKMHGRPRPFSNERPIF